MTAGVARRRWSRRDVVALAGVVARRDRRSGSSCCRPRDSAAISTSSCGWAHHIATSGLGTLYGQTAAGPVTFGPVLGYIQAVLTAVDPAFRTATDASDRGIRILMKLPASIADIGLGLLVAYALRARPRLGGRRRRG